MIDDETRARIQIQYTMAVYCNSVDSGEIEGVVSCFAEDASLELSSGASVRGRDAIRKFYEPVIGATRPDRAPGEAISLLRHNLTTSRVEFLTADTAQGWTYFMSLAKHGLDHAGRYLDLFSRRGDRWLLDERRIVVEWYGSPSWYEQFRLKPGTKPR